MNLKLCTRTQLCFVIKFMLIYIKRKQKKKKVKRETRASFWALNIYTHYNKTSTYVHVQICFSAKFSVFIIL